ncbi:MAG TPA: hypothetical protein VFJ63_00690 [Candidatus Bathyarchaeia archaeon]|nr:hypothetical protein [Candidatus Bathyarchaeia archaeon]
MAASVVSDEPLSLLQITIRRSITTGRAALIYGSGVSVFLGIVLSLSSPTGFSAGFPIFLPIFATVGSMGGLTVFTGDRLKGVLEYLMAYGVSPRRLFLNILLASLVLVTIVLGIALSVGLGIFLLRGNSFSDTLAFLLLLYALPMSYASAAFASTIGMYWTALSSPRQGLNSPLGVIPFIGILPSIATLGGVIALGIFGNDSAGSSFVKATSISLTLVTVFVVVLLGRIGRLLRRERLLSPA